MEKAHLIISTEYWANEPSVFLFYNQNYYGCKIYPTCRDFPKNIDYWKTATSSDDGRYFDVKEVVISDDELIEIKILQDAIDSNQILAIRKSFDFKYIQKNWKIKRGKNYELWKAEKEAQEKEILEDEQRIRPFENARNIAFKRLKNLLLNL
jgi:hypothetical protein